VLRERGEPGLATTCADRLKEVLLKTTWRAGQQHNCRWGEVKDEDGEERWDEERVVEGGGDEIQPLPRSAQ
jgi:hypothetical protein